MPVNASVASPGPYTVPLKLLTDTVAAGSVVLAATAANPKTNDILFILCILLQIAIRRYYTTPVNPPPKQRHPFPDGNGRTGRLWQTALLGSWRNEFYGAPVENIVWAHQQEYYQAIRASTAAGECGPFIDFMLDKILRTLKAKGKAYEIAAAETDKKTIEKTNKKTDQKIISIMKSMPDVTLAELVVASDTFPLPSFFNH